MTGECGDKFNNDQIEPAILPEHLLTSSGRIDMQRIQDMEMWLDNAVEELNQARKSSYYAVDAEDEANINAAYEGACESADQRFSELANVLLNTLDVSESETVADEVFLNLGKALKKVSGDSYEFPSVYSVYDRIIANFDKVKTVLQRNNALVLEPVAMMADSGFDEQKEKANKFAVETLPIIKDLIDQFGVAFNTAVVLQKLLESGSDQLVTEISEMTRRFVTDKFSFRSGVKILASSFFSEKYRGRVADKGREIIVDAICALGIERNVAEEWAEDWTRNYTYRENGVDKTSDNADKSVVKSNIETFISVERASPGIAKFLNDKCGIVDFGRYPERMLLDQKFFAEDIDRPYGIILFPRADHNRAFHRRELLDKLQQDLDETLELQDKDCLIRIRECGSREEVARALVDLDRKYGGSHKISFAIIGGHGTKDTISFGDKFHGGYLRATDLHKRKVQKTGDFFEPEATIILSSCSTGQNEGIGQTLSEKFKLKVVAPKVPTSVSKITPKLVDGKIDFDVEYREEEAGAVYEAKDR